MDRLENEYLKFSWDGVIFSSKSVVAKSDTYLLTWHISTFIEMIDWVEHVKAVEVVTNYELRENTLNNAIVSKVLVNENMILLRAWNNFKENWLIFGFANLFEVGQWSSS